MKKSRLLSMICVGIFLVAQAVSFEVAAAFLSQVNTHGELFDPTTESVGGWDVRTTELSNFGSDVLDVGGTRSISAWTIASAETGRLAFNLSSSITVDAGAPQGRLSAFVQSTNNRVIDDFTIGAGGGLVNGDPAQVRFQVQLDGAVQVQGRPSGGTQFAFSIRAGAGTTNLPLVVDFDTGGLSPPQAFEVHEQWDIIVDVTVGGKMRVDALMSGWMNGTAFDPGQSGTNFLDFDPIIRVSNAPGFNLSITSDATYVNDDEIFDFLPAILSAAKKVPEPPPSSIDFTGTWSIHEVASSPDPLCSAEVNFTAIVKKPNGGVYAVDFGHKTAHGSITDDVLVVSFDGDYIEGGGITTSVFSGEFSYNSKTGYSFTGNEVWSWTETGGEHSCTGLSTFTGTKNTI